MLETFNAFVTKINGFVWGPVMLILLVGTHVYLTFRTRIIQRKTITAIKLSVTPDSEASGDVSGFGALATALAATIGTGNIVGVATAIGAGDSCENKRQACHDYKGGKGRKENAAAPAL